MQELTENVIIKFRNPRMWRIHVFKNHLSLKVQCSLINCESNKVSMIYTRKEIEFWSQRKKLSIDQGWATKSKKRTNFIKSNHLSSIMKEQNPLKCLFQNSKTCKKSTWIIKLQISHQCLICTLKTTWTPDSSIKYQWLKSLWRNRNK